MKENFDKVDIAALRRDLPKWYAFMPLFAKEWWESFIDGFGEVVDVVDTETRSPVQELKIHTQRPSEDPTLEPSGDLLLDIGKFREKETAPLPEVSVNVIFFVSQNIQMTKNLT